MSDKMKNTEALLERYPYWIVPAVDTLLDDGPALTAEELAKLRRRIASQLGDEDALRRLVGDAERERIFDDFYPDTHVATPSTDSTIDAFLDKFGHGAASRSEEADDLELQRMLGTPSTYALTLEEESREEPVVSKKEEDKTAASKKESIAVARKESNGAKESNEGDLTESLAHVMIKNGNYAKALEIITQLSLKNPEKSIYFADQIRFLRKLVYLSGL